MLLLYGDLLCFLETVAMYTNYIVLDLPISIYYQNELQRFLSENEKVEDFTIDGEKGWGDCPEASHIFNQKYLKIYSLDGYFSKMVTLHDFVLEYRTIATNFLNKTKNKEKYWEEYYYVVNNGMITAPIFLKNDYDSLIYCSKLWVGSFSQIKQILLILQISLTLVCFCLIMFKVYHVTKITNIVWNKISESTFATFYDIRNKCIHRLTTFLDTTDEEASLLYEYNRVRKNIFEVKFSQLWPYIWRILIFVILSNLYFIFVCFIQSAAVENLIVENNLIKDALYHKSELIIEANFWTVSSFIPQLDSNLKSQYFNETISTNSIADKRLFKKAYSKFFESKGLDMLYKHYDSNITHGLLTDSRAALIDACFIFLNKSQNDLNSFSNKMSDLYDLSKDIILLSNTNGKDIINRDYGFQIFSIVICSIFGLLLYLLLYYPFFNSKSFQLVKMKDLSRMFVLNLKEEIPKNM